MTLRQGLEQSKNLVTARLLDGGIAADPPESLDKVCAIAMDTKVYTSCERYYPFVLGSQPVRPLDLALFYATVANEGGRPTPYAIETIERDGREVYRHAQLPPVQMTSVDRPAFYQLKTMLQGVLARGTAYSIHNMSLYVGGKTGTTDEENDAWFVGFTPDWVCGVWTGNDDNRPMNRISGGDLPAEIWRRVMLAAHEGLPARDFAWVEPVAAPGEAASTPGASGEARSAFYQTLAAEFARTSPEPDPSELYTDVYL